MPRDEILCVGELLWDALPAGLFLGGAPFNVACHLRAAGLPVAMVSRVGSDHLGAEAVRRAARYGVATDLIQTDPSLPTGFVRVTMDGDDDPSYEIVEPAAWDRIEATGDLLHRAGDARAIVFGTLAQRDQVSRRTIERLWDSAALKVLDVNLRPPFDEREVVRRSLRCADVAKMNAEEMRQLAEWFDLGESPRAIAAALAEEFDCPTVCITRGREGAALLRDGRWTEHPGFEVEVRDTVGAGDAFLAVLLAGLLAGTDGQALLRHANLIGAYVVTQSGAVPSDQPDAGAGSPGGAGPGAASPDAASPGAPASPARGRRRAGR